MSSRIRQEARAFDDAALAALASVGLIRRGRKFVSATAIETEDPGSMRVRVSDDLVTFETDAGLGNATCSCSTVGPCQHLVAAILHIRHDSTREPGPESPDEQTAQDLPQLAVSGWLVDLTPAELRSFVGTPNLRWALARLEATDHDLVEIGEGAGVTVRLPTEVEVRFMAPSLASAFCDPATSHDRRQIALAVLILQARAGLPTPTLEAPARQARITPGRSELARTAAAAAHDALTIGIAHLSAAPAERFEAIAIEARGVKLYRLGQLAAGIASGIEDLVDRRATADAGLLLAELALLHALIERLVSVLERDGDIPPWLAGSARAEYAQAGTNELLSLGAYPWETSSGYSGVTGVFYDKTRKRFVELGGGRRDRSLNPTQIYKDVIGWSGGHTLESMRGRRVRLTGSLVSASGRLSTSSRTSAELLGAWTPAELSAADWDGSVPRQLSRLRGEGATTWASLRIEATGAVTFDQVTQHLVWPVRSADCDVVVTIPWTTVNSAAVEATERLATQSPSHLIGRLWPASGQAHLHPVSALVRGGLRVLAFDTPDQKRTLRRQDRHQPNAIVANRSLERVGSRVLQLAERGLDDSAGLLLTGIAAEASEHGFPLIGRVLRDDTAVPSSRLLRAAHIIEEHRHYVG